MLFSKDNLQKISNSIDTVIEKIHELESKYKLQIKNVHPNYRGSAKNLIQYLALRSFDVDLFQEKLGEIGLPNSPGSENNVLYNLLTFKTLINSLLKVETEELKDDYLNNKEAKEVLRKNSNALLGTRKNNRKTAILITQPTEVSEDATFAKSLLKLGMDCARINCAHDDETVWKKIINNIQEHGKSCKIMMDLGGPKIRTGKMKPGHKVIHIKPKRNTLGQVVNPAKIWMAPYGILPPNQEEADVIIPINKKWLRKTKPGSYFIFNDSRGKKCKINIDKKEGLGRWGSTTDSSYITTGTLLNVFKEKKKTAEIHTIHELLPLEEVIYLFEGDTLRLDKETHLGEPAVRDDQNNVIKMAHISCTLPEIFKTVEISEQIFFDDGKIEGSIKEIHSEYILVEITNTKKNGGKLKADKGINLPNSKLGVRGLTSKDINDLKFVAQHADVVNFSFVNNKQDVEDLLNELKKLEANLGIVLKIETVEAYKNLPSIILKAMENYPIGVMIARGDLAIEVGWKNVAIIQEEILRICDAARIPDIWATQVLENLAKKGIPTRAEITDAAMAQRAECVMLNKGPYIEKAVKMLDKILCEMQQIQKDKISLLPKLEFNEDL